MLPPTITDVLRFASTMHTRLSEPSAELITSAVDLTRGGGPNEEVCADLANAAFLIYYYGTERL